jgi:hypothetical protein
LKSFNPGDGSLALKRTTRDSNRSIPARLSDVRFTPGRDIQWSRWPRSPTVQEPQIERPEHQDYSDVHHQPLPEPIPEEQDIQADYDGYQREHVKHDRCLSSHRSFLVRAAELNQSGAWMLTTSFEECQLQD